MISIDYPASKCEKQLKELPDKETLKNFVFQECKAEANWNMKNFIEDQVELIRKQVGDKKVLLALSGGVISGTLWEIFPTDIGSSIRAHKIINRFSFARTFSSSAICLAFSSIFPFLSILHLADSLGGKSYECSENKLL